MKDTMRNLCIMLQHEGKLWSIREWASGFRFLFVKPGILRRESRETGCAFSAAIFTHGRSTIATSISEWEADEQAAGSTVDRHAPGPLRVDICRTWSSIGAGKSTPQANGSRSLMKTTTSS